MPLNHLKNSKSPYLRQHSTNPVMWHPWGKEALQKAKKEDKPLFLSIGYSACHWCHVMRRETFEDEEVAQYLNAHFINIKVDREERPDVDALYMEAIQKMGLQGGWPLNIFLLPDQKPFYGGTYFKKKSWLHLIQSIYEAFTFEKDKIEESAHQFTLALSESWKENTSEIPIPTVINEKIWTQVSEKISLNFDFQNGGTLNAPKFPMPTFWEMIARFQYFFPNETLKNQFFLTLNKMSWGGIYDHIGGGFSRYATDSYWHIPHFEKMLYDNAQMLSLFAMGYKISKNKYYSLILDETFTWLSENMLDKNGGFYASQDADSQGEEGKFYCWTEEEFHALLTQENEWIKAIFQITKEGNWEMGKNVPRLCQSLHHTAEDLGIDEREFYEILKKFKIAAKTKRKERILPTTDKKQMAGWNALTLKGLCDSYQALGEEKYLKMATQNAQFISSLIEDKKLYRFPNQNMEGFLDDYAMVIMGFITYFQTSSEKKYLLLAKQLTNLVLEKFQDPKSPLFFFSSSQSHDLIVRKKECYDDVIPSSNAVMARNLFILSTYFYNENYQNIAQKMLEAVSEKVMENPLYYSCWLSLLLEKNKKPIEMTIVGKDFAKLRNECNQYFLPHVHICASENDTETINCLADKPSNAHFTNLYVCKNNTCYPAVNTLEEALNLIR